MAVKSVRTRTSCSPRGGTSAHTISPCPVARIQNCRTRRLSTSAIVPDLRPPTQIASFTPPGRRVDAALGQQPVLAQLTAFTGVGKEQQKLPGQGQRTVGRLQIRPPLDGKPP